MPKCFTANVITSAQVPRFRALRLFPVVFYFQVSFWCHPPLIPLEDAILRMLLPMLMLMLVGFFIQVVWKTVSCQGAGTEVSVALPDTFKLHKVRNSARLCVLNAKDCHLRCKRERLLGQLGSHKCAVDGL